MNKKNKELYVIPICEAFCALELGTVVATSLKPTNLEDFTEENGEWTSLL